LIERKKERKEKKKERKKECKKRRKEGMRWKFRRVKIGACQVSLSREYYLGALATF